MKTTAHTSPNPDQLDTDLDGQGGLCQASPQDRDGDGFPNGQDNCPDTASLNIGDRDADGIGDICDNCIAVANQDGADEDDDGAGDACDIVDADHDGVPDAEDSCPDVFNPEQTDLDQDQATSVNRTSLIVTETDWQITSNHVESGRTQTQKQTAQLAVPEDDDGDGIANDNDNCPFIPNADQNEDCAADMDGDGIANAMDNCPEFANPGQEEVAEGRGAACWLVNPPPVDGDEDGVPDAIDNFAPPLKTLSKPTLMKTVLATFANCSLSTKMVTALLTISIIASCPTPNSSSANASDCRQRAPMKMASMMGSTPAYSLPTLSRRPMMSASPIRTPMGSKTPKTIAQTPPTRTRTGSHRDSR